MEEVFFLSINDFSKRGYGLSDNFEVFGALPGDEIKAQMIKRCKAKKVELITASNHRVVPKFPYEGACGGCTFQQLDYKEQLILKQKRLKSLFTITPEPMIPCDNPFEYRNKMEFTFSQDKAGKRFLGLHMPQTKGRIVDLSTCHLVSPWFTEVLDKVRKWWEEHELPAFKPHRGEGVLRTITIREGKRTGARMVLLTVSGKARDAITMPALEAFKQLFNKDISLFLIIQQATAGRPTQFFEMHLQGPDHLTEELHIDQRILRFKISPLAFFQPNTFQAEKLYQAALNLIPTPGNHLLDLYAGTATLGMLFAPYTKQVTSIELNPYSILDAEENLVQNQISNLSLIRGDVAEHLPIAADTIILDPPRSGLGPKACAQINALDAKQILYISCNPTTQAEDLAHLSNYTLTHLQPVDQFPHTPHLETIALLEHI